MFSMSPTRSRSESKRGREPSARLTHTQLTARQESPLVFKRFFLASEGLDIQRCGTGTSARALETLMPSPEQREMNWQVGLTSPAVSLETLFLLLMNYLKKMARGIQWVMPYETHTGCQSKRGCFGQE